MRPEMALRRFELYLKTKGLRVTKPRREILELAWSTHSHFSAEELYAWSRAKSSAVSRATVYRTLTLLVEAGFLSALDGGRGQLLYEHILGHHHHDHMICLECSRIFEFRSDAIERLQEEAAESRHFRMVSHNLTIEGYCSQCLRENPSLAEALPEGESASSAG